MQPTEMDPMPVTATPGWFRRGLVTEIAGRHPIWWDGTMAILAVGYVAFAVASDQMTGHYSPYLLPALNAIFVAEFALRLWDSPSRRAYARTHWIDAVACLPLLGVFHNFQVLNLLRLGVVLRVFRIADDTRNYGPNVRESMWFVGPSLLTLWMGGAYAMWTFEHNVNPHVHSFADALYWSFITATTVGYGDIAPVTTGGKIVSGVLVFLGLGLLGFASSHLTAYWLHDSHRSDELLEEIHSLRTAVDDLRRLLEEQQGQ